MKTITTRLARTTEPLRIALLRAYFLLTGRCVSFLPGPDGICRVCRWTRPS